MKILARRYDNSEAIALTVDGDRIARIEPAAAADNLPWIAPGFVDLQVNGFGGKDFASAALTVDHVREISLAMDQFGCVQYCPTVTTQSYDVIAHGLSVIAAACDKIAAVADRVAGIHLEGPYISREDGPRGAHPLAHVRPPDWEEFCRWQDAAGGRIRIVTLSPEYDAACQFIRQATAAGVTVAIGHTAADSRQMEAAVDAGARFSTHLGNGSHPVICRHPNYIWDQLADDRLWASLIVDGHHLPPAVVKSFVRAKGPERIVLVSDITGMAGMPPGEYRGTSLGDVDVLEDGKLVVGGQRQLLAGASRPIGVGVANVMHFAGVDLKTAVDMASARPLELLGLPSAALRPGAPANLACIELAADSGAFRTVKTIVRGEVVYES
ncbi:MAG: amidohydrolase family protein [Planctomycetales bacterium]|nr:amidohydrolase family protein [Planctomycetales bacterium]